MSLLDRLLNGHGVNLVRAPVEALAEPVMVGVTGARTADVHFGLRQTTELGDHKDKYSLHGVGAFTL